MEPSVKLSAVTCPVELELQGVSMVELVAYYARVSNPGNQMNHETAPKLVKYLIDHNHWSPLEMVQIVMEIVTTRDIAHQIVRHRSFSFQEFSQRYAEVDETMFIKSECRMQDRKNRQASLECKDDDIMKEWEYIQNQTIEDAISRYKWAIDSGIAKEVARKILPEGLAATRLFMSGTLRSWLHYCEARTYAGAQLEHRVLALMAQKITNELMGVVL